MKVFQINEIEWWAGPDLESVIAEVKAQCGDDSTIEDPSELGPKSMEKFTFVDEHEKDQKPRTFREQLDFMIERGEKFPCFFATSEY